MSIKIVNLEHLSVKQLHGKNGELYAESALISEALGLKQVFMHYDVLQPNHRASSAHFHEISEEIIIIIAGSPTFLCGPEERLLGPGDVLSIAPGGPDPHYLENRSSAKVSFLVINGRVSEADLIHLSGESSQQSTSNGG